MYRYYEYLLLNANCNSDWWKLKEVVVPTYPGEKITDEKEKEEFEKHRSEMPAWHDKECKCGEEVDIW